MSTSHQEGLEGPGREAHRGEMGLPTSLQAHWEGGHEERHQASTEQEMLLPPPVMNVGPATPGGDPGRADKWIPNGVGQIYEWLAIKGSEEKPG